LAHLADEEAEQLLIGRRGEMADDLAQRALRDDHGRRRELRRTRELLYRLPENRLVVGKGLADLQGLRWALLGVPLSHGGHLGGATIYTFTPNRASGERFDAQR